MNRCTFCLVLGFVLLSLTSARNLREKRQSNDNEDDLDDRYNFERPNRQWLPNRPSRPAQFPNIFPGQNGQNLFPGQTGQNQFPGQNGQSQNGQNQNGQNQLPTQNVQTTTASSAVQDCVRNCLVTAEYNPVCGTNGMTYTNPGRLTCAQNCGVAVNLLRASPCPSSTTAAPVAAM